MTAPMTEEQLQEIRELVSACHSKHKADHVDTIWDLLRGPGMCDECAERTSFSPEDDAFVAAAYRFVPALLAELDRIRDLLRPAVKYPCEIKAAKGCADAIGMERIDQWCLPCFARYVRGEQAEGDGDE